MTRRKRNTIIVAGLAALLVGAEVGLNLWRGRETIVQVKNEGAEPIEGLTFRFGTRQTNVARVLPGESARVYLSGRRPGTLTMAFRQKGNAMTGYQVPEFDPDLMSREGFKLVLEVRPNEVVRYQEDSEPVSPLGQVVQGFTQRFWDSIAEGM
jgi:hypothetical protein